ncbi:hypothetical protein [Bartonella sp. LJL80]
MSELVFASQILKEHIAPRSVGDQIKARIRYAARKLGWSYTRTNDVWYADERISLKPRELRQIEDYTGIYYGRKEAQEIDDLINAADSFFVGEDENFVRAFFAAFRTFKRTLDSAGTEGGSGKETSE